MFSSIKETNWLISKGMCVLYLMFLVDVLSKELNRLKNIKHLLLKKTDVLKIGRKVNFSERKFEEMHQF